MQPSRLSFKTAVAAIRQFAPEFQRTTRRRRAALFRSLLDAIADVPLPERESRSEPRAVKYRGTGYAILNSPRHLFVDTPHRNRHVGRKPAQTAPQA